jgi:hypothetical protein
MEGSIVSACAIERDFSQFVIPLYFQLFMLQDGRIEWASDASFVKAIELAFGVLKEHLQVSQLWSAKWEVVQVQIWCALLLAQVFHGLQVQLAAQEGVDPFDVSIDLLVEVVPRLLQRGIAPLPYLGQRGRELGHIRPSSRIQIEVPWVDPSWITPAPPEAVLPRETARYAQRKCAPGPRSSARKAG